MKDTWNPWHGCKKYSEGCVNCYVYRRDAAFGKDSSIVHKTADFDLPLRKKRDGTYSMPGGSVFACLTSDFFIDAADEWRGDIWNAIRIRQDIHFSIITKRVLRIAKCLPDDWQDGWDNVSIGATVENQRCADERMDTFVKMPVKDRFIICEPMLEKIDLSKWLQSERVSAVIAGGESGENARPLDYEWVLDLRRQCLENGVKFRFKQTGSNFIKDGKLYRIERMLQIPQARRAGIDIE